MEFTYASTQVFDNSPREKYRSRHEEEKIPKWGQRKLLLSEILFLNLTVGDKPAICIYVGAAPGDHTGFLAKMFPQVEFHLYDDNPDWDFNVKESENIKIFRQYFTKDDIARYTEGVERSETDRGETGGTGDSGGDNRSLLFISDLRTAVIDPDNTDYQTNVDHEIGIWNDMKLQQYFVRKLKCNHAYLKFRLPFSNVKPEDLEFVTLNDNGEPEVEYLDGKIFYQTWESGSSTEGRLWVTKKNDSYDKRKYNYLAYEEQMFYHNNQIRNKVGYNNLFTNSPESYANSELLNDFDSTFEAYILAMYCKKIQVSVISKNVTELSNHITNFLGGKNLTYRRNHLVSRVPPVPPAPKVPRGITIKKK